MFAAWTVFLSTAASPHINVLSSQACRRKRPPSCSKPAPCQQRCAAIGTEIKPDALGATGPEKSRIEVSSCVCVFVLVHSGEENILES